MMSLPDFIVIGPGKTGTSWLYECLLEHPEICLAKDIKETLFFLDNYEKGVDWYEGLFAECPATSTKGEISNTYFFSEEAPARVKETVADVKLVASLRNPMDRVFSLYLFRVRNGLISAPFEEAIEADPTIIEQNFFYTHLSRWLEYFDRSQLHVAFFDDLKEEPRIYLDGILEFLGVSTKVDLPSIDKTVLPASRPRSAPVFHAAKRAGLVARRLEMFKLLTWAKRSKLVNRVLLKPYDADDRPVMADATRQRLRDVYREEIAKTGELLGCDLSGWQ